MPDRHSDRERWEILITTILMAFRPFLFMGGIMILVYAITALTAYPIVGVIAVALAFLLFLLVFSDHAILYLARVGAWMRTFGRD